MRYLALPVCFLSLLFSSNISADDEQPRVIKINCDHGKSLQKVINRSRPHQSILVKGSCRGPILINKPLTLYGVGEASIGAAGEDAITVTGTSDVHIGKLHILNSNNGLVVTDGASVEARDMMIHDHASMGVLISNGGKLKLASSHVAGNGINGIDLNNGAMTIAGEVHVHGHVRAFGVNAVNTSSITVDGGALHAGHNALGIQVGINSSMYIASAESSVHAGHNAFTGLTVVSGSNLFVFSGQVHLHNNGFHGLSLRTKSTVDLDRAASIMSKENGGNGVLMENSMINLFTLPFLTEAPSMTLNDNGENGILLEKHAVLDVSPGAVVTANNNDNNGLLADFSSAAILNTSTLSGNGHHDLLFRFGSRADINDNSFDNIACDDSVSMRGNNAVSCPVGH